MCFALFMIMLDNTVVNVALPSIQRDLGASLSALEWTVNGYTLSFAVLLATGGRLGDIFGRRLTFMVGVVVFAASSATAGLAPDPTFLILSRVVQGIGAALMMPATLSIVTDAFPASERGKAMGTWAGVSALALAIGPVLGGFLTEHVSWRAIFYLNIPVAVGAIAAALFAGAGLGLAAFVAIEERVKVPMVEFRFFSDRNFLGAVIVALIVSFAMLGVFFFLALYMQNILGYSPLEAGVRFLPSTLMIVGVAPVAGRLSDRFGARWLIAGGLAIVAASLYSFSGIAVDSNYLDLLPGFTLLGIGIAMTMSPMTSAAMNAVAVEKAGIASGVLSMFRMVGGSLGVAVTGAIFQGAVGNPATATPAEFVDALGHAMLVCSAVALAGAAIGAAAIRAKGRPLGPAEAEAALAMNPDPADRAEAASRP